MTRVREQFSVEAMCTSTLALYRELLVGPVHS